MENYSDFSPDLSRRSWKKTNRSSSQSNKRARKAEELTQIYMNLLQILKKKISVAERNQNVQFYEKLVPQTADNLKECELIRKIMGLITYLKKGRKQFISDVTSMKVEIMTCNDQDQMVLEKINETASATIPFSLLTNDNFDTDERKLSSGDMFGESINDIHRYSQQNYEMVKQLMINSDSELTQMYKAAEEDFSTLMLLKPKQEMVDDDETPDLDIDKMSEKLSEVSTSGNIFGAYEYISLKVKYNERMESINKCLLEVLTGIEGVADDELNTSIQSYTSCCNSKGEKSVIHQTTPTLENIRAIDEAHAKFLEAYSNDPDSEDISQLLNIS